MTPEERRLKASDFMMFPTASEPWVDPESIEEIRTSGMPAVLFNALYLAIIPEDDVALFPNLDLLWTGPAPKGWEKGRTYIAGIDLGRKRDFTVVSVFDVTSRRFCAAIRLYKIGWTMQYERAAALYRTWHCSRAWVDQSGLGDPVVEELAERRMTVEGFVFSEQSRKQLVEHGSAQCDGKTFTVPDTEDFAPHKAELDSFEIVVSKNVQGKIAYRVPENSHDDAAFSMLLALWGADQGNFGSPRIASMSQMDRKDRAERAESGVEIDLDIEALDDPSDYSGY